MNTNKAAYWIAVGALALGLNSEYRHGNFVALHRVADRAGSAVCRMTNRAEKNLAMAIFLVRPEAGLAVAQVASSGEADIVRSRADMLREQGKEETVALRDGLRDRIRDQVRDEIRAHADVIRARAEMRRAEIEIQQNTRSLVSFANINDRDATVFCPRTAMRIVRTTVDQAMIGRATIAPGR
jgi:hypothetical protein